MQRYHLKSDVVSKYWMTVTALGSLLSSKIDVAKLSRFDVSITVLQQQRSYSQKKLYFALCLLSTAGLVFFFIQHRIYCKPNGECLVAFYSVSNFDSVFTVGNMATVCCGL